MGAWVGERPSPSDAAPQQLNRVDSWRPRGLDAVELHHGSGVTQEYPRHWHDEIYLCAVLRGASSLDVRGTSLSVPHEALAVVPSGEVHANRKVGCTFRCVFMDFPALHRTVERFLERNIPAPDFRSGLLADPQITSDFLRCHRALQDPSSELEEDGSLLVFLQRLVTGHSFATIPVPRDGNEDAAVQRTRKYLDEHYDEHVSLSDLARLAGVSPFHLNRSFSRKVGMPPHAYQLQVRIAHARRFLRQGRSAAETAFLAGFFDQSHFTHHFKRSEGMTPLQYLRYRKNLQDNQTHTAYLGSP